MSKTADDDLNRRLHEAEKVRLLRLPNFPPRPQDDEHGVLLSDRIEAYCRKYQLVSPFEKNQLRSASYALAVGRYYSIGGLRKSLAEGESLTIEPYQVAIIQTYETINMPPYLIGRWNVQVTKAYDGLLWVGGAQVDPGFRGYLCCPIYNLSAKKVTLHFRDKLAVIDFVTTTPYVEGKCLPYDWRNRKRLIFQDYPTLNSGIEHKVKKFEDSIRAEADKTKEKLAEAADGTQRSLQYAVHQLANRHLSDACLHCGRCLVRWLGDRRDNWPGGAVLPEPFGVDCCHRPVFRSARKSIFSRGRCIR